MHSKRKAIKDIFGTLVRFVCITIIHAVRPLLGPAACKFPVTCTRYAIIQLETLPLHKAFYQIARRLISCNPFW